MGTETIQIIAGIGFVLTLLVLVQRRRTKVK
jgi:hypothetical protein